MLDEVEILESGRERVVPLWPRSAEALRDELPAARCELALTRRLCSSLGRHADMPS